MGKEESHPRKESKTYSTTSSKRVGAHDVSCSADSLFIERGSQNQGCKLVKRGFRMPIAPKTCGIVFEEVPAWLWSIRASDFSQMLIPQTCELMLRQHFTSTWEYFESKLVIISAEMIGAVEADIWFVSGSRSFLERQALPETTPVVAWLFPTGRRKPENSGTGVWIKIAHSQVGGVTNMAGTFCIRHLPAIQIEVDPISRSIEHIIKHSERPIPCGLDELTSLPHYRVSDRLSRHHLERTVLLPTGFSRTGWGQRPLVASELGHAFHGINKWGQTWFPCRSSVLS